MSEIRHSKKVTNKEDIDYILSLNYDNITQSVIMELFGEFDGKRKYNPYDIITIPAGTYGKEGNKNLEPFDTTIGCWIFNRFFIEKDFFDLFQYVDQEVTDVIYGKINKSQSYALMEDIISLDALKEYLMKAQFFQQFSTMLCPSYSEKMLCCSAAIDKKKEELINTKYKDKIEAGDEVAASELEAELIAYAKEYLKGDPGLDMYLSGSRGSFGNNFKNMFIMRGAIKDPDPTKGYKIITDNYADGISKENYSAMASALVDGPYKRGKKTQDGGWWEKLFVAAFQHVVAGEPGSDCGTKRHIIVHLDKSNIDGFMYSNMIEGDHLVELNSMNRDKYLGKTVKFRFSSMCEAENPCNACLGNTYYKLGIKNIGTTTPMVPSVIKNISMKSFHNTVIGIAEMDVNKAFGV